MRFLVYFLPADDPEGGGEGEINIGFPPTYAGTLEECQSFARSTKGDWFFWMLAEADGKPDPSRYYIAHKIGQFLFRRSRVGLPVIEEGVFLLTVARDGQTISVTEEGFDLFYRDPRMAPGMVMEGEVVGHPGTLRWTRVGRSFAGHFALHKD